MTSRSTPAAPTQPVAAEPAASTELEQLAQLVSTLRPDWRGDIWLYYQTRSDLIARLRRAARRAGEMERALAQREAGAR